NGAEGLSGAGLVSAVVRMGRQGRKRNSLPEPLLQRVSRYGRVPQTSDRRRRPWRWRRSRCSSSGGPRPIAVGALYERPFLLKSTENGRSQTAPTADLRLMDGSSV